MTSKHCGRYCINCRYSFWSIQKLQAHEKVCKNNDYWHFNIPEEFDKISNFNQGQKSVKMLFVIYENSVLLLEKIDQGKIIQNGLSSKSKQACVVSLFSIGTVCLWCSKKSTLLIQSWILYKMFSKNLGMQMK